MATELEWGGGVKGLSDRELNNSLIQDDTHLTFFCFREGACPHLPSDPGDKIPVTNKNNTIYRSIYRLNIGP